MTNLPIQSPSAIILRDFVPSDAAAILRIYGHYVRHTVATFEETAPTADQIIKRFQSVIDYGAPYIVAELDGEVCGYAYASAFRTRSAYRYSVEDSIYVDPLTSRKGIGSRLLGELIERCTDLGFRQMIAVIGSLNNEASINFHKRFDFELSGTLKSAGFKFDSWVDVQIMQRPLGKGDQTLPTL